MSYDHYGTFGPYTEFGASLYPSDRHLEQPNPVYPYPTTSSDDAVKHYVSQGLAADKILLGLPFYCHSYYIKSRNLFMNGDGNPGLHAPVLDPNISGQISYKDALSRYQYEDIFRYSVKVNDHTGHYSASTYWGLIPIPHTDKLRFLSCDNPASVKEKINYVLGNNPLSEDNNKAKLAGVSFWSLGQDVQYNNKYSLLQAIHKRFEQATNNTQNTD